VMEYMYFALPIVAYDLRETRVSAQRAAVYASPNDEHDLAKRVGELLDAPADRAEMAKYGYSRVRESLAWQYSIANLLAAYDHAFRGQAEVQAVSA